MASFDIQTFVTGQTVTMSQMSNFYNGKDQSLSAYFPQTPLILNGMSITQTGTSNVFSFTAGQIRFVDQTNVNSGSILQMTLANSVAITNLTITTNTGSTPQYYIVAVLTLTASDSYNINTSATISSIALSLAEIASTSNPALYVPLYTITTTDNINYVIGTDIHCALILGYPDIVDDQINASVTIGGRRIDASQQLISTDSGGHVSLVGTGVVGGSASYAIMSLTASDGITVVNGVIVQFGSLPGLVPQASPSSLIKLYSSFMTAYDVSTNTYSNPSLNNLTSCIILTRSAGTNNRIQYNVVIGGSFTANVGITGFTVPLSGYGLSTCIFTSYGSASAEAAAYSGSVAANVDIAGGNASYTVACENMSSAATQISFTLSFAAYE